MIEMNKLLSNIPQVGRVEWIGRSPSREAEIEAIASVTVAPGTGLVGDHHAMSGDSQRQVTLIQAEHLPIIASLSGVDEVSPKQCRRNIVVAGLNLLSVKTRRFQIGDVVLEGSGPCAPCSRMLQTIGPGGYQAMRGHGGITAVVIEGGSIGIGDEVKALPESE